MEVRANDIINIYREWLEIWISLSYGALFSATYNGDSHKIYYISACWGEVYQAERNTKSLFDFNLNL